MAAKLNLFDKAIALISPQTALSRARARVSLNLVNKRFFEGASAGRRTAGWKTPSTSASAEISNASAALRDRARDLVRNNAFAAKGLQVIVSNVVGYGIKAQIKSASNRGLEPIKLAWKNWAETTACDFHKRKDYAGLQAQVMRTVAESGEALVLRQKLSSESQEIPLAVKILEPDYIDKGKQDADTIDGIQFDKSGKVSGYWLWEKHPGDTALSNFYQTISLKSSLVPASDVIHIFREDRAGQIRGVSWFAPIIISLRELDEYMDATIVKQKVAACFAAFIHDIEPTGGEDTATQSISEKLEPGIMEILPPGKEVSFSNPPSVTEFDPFTRTMLRSVATGLGITYEALSGDYSQVNFSSGRMGWLEFQRNLESWRWQMLIPQFCVPFTKWFMEAAELRGIKLNNCYFEHTPPSREMIDPNAETNAIINGVRAGIKSLPEAIRELGFDPETVLNEIEAFNKLLDAKGIILDTDPRRIMKSSGSFQPDNSGGSTSTPPATAQNNYFIDEQNQVWVKNERGFTKIK